MINLEKHEERFWTTVIEGDPEIDKTKVDSTRAITDFDEQTQCDYERVMFDHHQKLQGKPTSQEKVVKNIWKMFVYQPFHSALKLKVLSLIKRLLRPIQTDATSHNIVACCWGLACCIGLHGPMFGFKLYATSANTVVVPCKRKQHVGPNNVACCWSTMLRVVCQQCCVRLHGPLLV